MSTPESIELLTADKETRKNALDFHFSLNLPSREPIEMYLTLIGKQLKRPANNPYSVKMFFGATYLFQYLDHALMFKRSDFFINGIVLTLGGRHAINVCAHREKSGPITLLFIDGGQHPADIRYFSDLEFKHKVKLHFIELDEMIQYSASGCRVLSTYLAGRFSNPAKAEQIKELMKNCLASIQFKLKLSDFPANLGLLLIAQSISKIKKAIEERGKERVLKEYPRYEDLYQKGLGFENSTDYVDIEGFNALHNQTLHRKNKNQLLHAKHALEVDLIPHLSSLLGMKELYPNSWPEMTAGVLEKGRNWDWLYREKAYTEKTFMPTRAIAQEPEAKKQKLSMKV